MRRRHRTRKKLVAKQSRSEGVYNRAGDLSVTFCGKGGATECVRRWLFKRKVVANDTQSATTWWRRSGSKLRFVRLALPSLSHFMSASLCLSANRSAWTNFASLASFGCFATLSHFMSASLCLSANPLGMDCSVRSDVILCKINKRQQTDRLLSFSWWRRSGSNR